MAHKHGMIEPFVEKQVRAGVISYGVSSYGYDIRCTNQFKPFVNVHGGIIDPKNFGVRTLIDIEADFYDIPPNSFALTRSVEYFRIPRNVMCIVMGKSTYARCGVIINVTPLEPDWEGYITMEISNTAPLPARIYANEGIGQVLFLESDEECETSYADKRGKYQRQQDIVLPKVEKDEH